MYLKALVDFDVFFVLINDGGAQDIHKEVNLIKDSGLPFYYDSYTFNLGKGGAIKYGVSQFPAQLVIYTDIDFPYTIDSVMGMLAALDSYQANIVMGIRDQAYFDHIPMQRRLISKGLIFLNKLLLDLPHPDTQCGIKCLDMLAQDQLAKVKNNGFLFEIELLQKAKTSLKVVPFKVQIDKHVILYNIRLSSLWNLIKEYFSIKQ